MQVDTSMIGCTVGCHPTFVAKTRTKMAREEEDAWRVPLLWLLDAYRATIPVKKIMEEMKTRHAVAEEWASVDFQDAVVSLVIHDAIAEKYSPPRSYTYRFLKLYTDAIERVGGELSDSLVCELMEFVAAGRVVEATASSGSQEMHHVTYRVPAAAAGLADDLTVTCRVASVFNEVGLKIWEAGWFLAEYILAHRELFEGRSVLELGAGVGITGFVLAKSVRARRLVMSDYAPQVMLNLRYNTEINSLLGGSYVCPVDVETIDWETWDPEQAAATKSYIRPVILLAGDCVYDVAVFPALVSVLQSFLGEDQAADDEATGSRQRVAIFAATIRNQATFQTFLDTLEQHQITYEDITSASLKTMSPEPLFPYDNRDQMRLCKLYRTATTEESSA